jgi:hypothetical protein
MILLLVIASWTLILALVVGLCTAARNGDLPPECASLSCASEEAVVLAAPVPSRLHLPADAPAQLIGAGRAAG